MVMSVCKICNLSLDFSQSERDGFSESDLTLGTCFSFFESHICAEAPASLFHLNFICIIFTQKIKQ